MLSAQEARDELKKDPIDRISNDMLEEIQLIANMYAVELEEKIQDGIKRALLNNKTKLLIEDDVFLYCLSDKWSFISSENIQNRMDLFRDMALSAIEREAIVESIKEVVSQQAKELRAIGYSVEVEYGDRTGVHNENLKDNNFRICIDWAEFPVEESDESDIINEEQQTQVRRVEYELNESEGKSVYKKASVDDRHTDYKWNEMAQSQSELKEIPKKKLKWWERLING